MGPVGIGCQSWMAIGGVDPITSMEATPAQRALYGAQAVLNATGLLGLTAGVGGGARTVGGQAGSATKPTLDLFDGKNAQAPGAINVDVTANIQSGIRADARQLPLKDGSVGEVVASNPSILKEAGDTFSMMDYLPEATREVEPGGKIFINANGENSYGKLPSASDFESLGVRVVQDGPLDSRFAGQIFLRTDGSVITNLDSMKTIILEKIK